MKLALHLLKIILIAGIISFFSFKLVNLGLQRQKNDAFGTLNTIVNGTEKYDVLFIGSSRTRNHFNPHLFDSISGLSSYNLGIYGIGIAESSMILERYLSSSHPKPQQVVFTVDPGILEHSGKIRFAQQYFPYYQDPIIYNTVKDLDPDMKFVKYFPFLAICKYNDYLKQLAVVRLTGKNQLQRVNIKGYEPLYGSHIKAVRTYSDKLRYNKEGMQILDKMCSLCKSNNIKLTLIIPAEYRVDNNTRPLDHSVLDGVRKKWQLEIFNYSNKELCYRKEFFYDNEHLNTMGADSFTVIATADILGPGKMIRTGNK